MSTDHQNMQPSRIAARVGYLPIAILALLSAKSAMAFSVTLHGVTDTLKPEYEKYADALKAGEGAFIDAERFFKEYEKKEGWKKEGKHTDFKVYQKVMPEGKITVVSTVLEGNIEDVMRETWGGIEGLPSWNPTIKFATMIAPLTDYSDIVYYGNNDVLVIKGREFLTVRLYRQTPIGYIMASRSVDLPEVPEKNDKIRANVLMGASLFRVDPSNPRKTLCDVVLSADLKGDLPKKLSMPAVMAMVAEQNIKHFKELSKYSK